MIEIAAFLQFVILLFYVSAEATEIESSYEQSFVLQHWLLMLIKEI
jgi:hypothetical protein